jgi:hypothetical protein
MGTEAGSDAGVYTRAVMRAWRLSLYARLRAHMQRAAAWDAAEGEVRCSSECV